jgi:hypothetical protein
VLADLNTLGNLTVNLIVASIGFGASRAAA